jgi:hypothetical protein
MMQKRKPDEREKKEGAGFMPLEDPLLDVLITVF